MKREEMETLVSGIREKVGEETGALIADDLGLLITDNSQMNTEIENRNTQIETLQKDKENLIASNGNLLKQIGMADELPPNFNKKDPDEDKKFNFKDAFDEKGRFKK